MLQTVSTNILQTASLAQDYSCSFAREPTLTHLPLNKMAAISQTTFSNAFSWMKILYFDSNFTEVCS